MRIFWKLPRIKQKRSPGATQRPILSMKFNTFCELFKEHSTAHWRFFLFWHISTDLSAPQLYIFKGFALSSYVTCGARSDPCLLAEPGLDHVQLYIDLPFHVLLFQSFIYIYLRAASPPCWDSILLSIGLARLSVNNFAAVRIPLRSGLIFRFTLKLPAVLFRLRGHQLLPRRFHSPHQTLR